ncbi:MAG: TetR/AcrR family transcriptional regulator [Anaerolineales bacterium]|nr:TetR/AcrR family transcriptional regulator [Anaerolineales bacterium]
MDAPPLTRHQRRRLLTRQQLIQAAVDLVLEKGYEAVTIQDVTDRADLGRGTFYIHFKDKEDVLWAAIQDGLQETEAEAHSQFQDGLPPQIEYYGYLNIFRHADRNRTLYRVMLGEQGSAVLTGRVQAHLAAEYERDLAALPQKIYTEFDVPTEILIQVVTGSVIQLVRWWLEVHNEYTPVQMAGMLYQSLHHKKPPARVGPSPLVD